jgi:hypothetical protein
MYDCNCNTFEGLIMEKYDWLRWVSFVAGVSILFFFLVNAKELLGSKVERFNILLFLLLLILPAIITALLSLFKKFWWLLPFSVWFGCVGTTAKYDEIEYSEILIALALVLLFVPFINMILGRMKTTSK